jgi:hypothetical protein
MGSAPASGAADDALVVRSCGGSDWTISGVRCAKDSARGRTERQPGRLYSPASPTSGSAMRRFTFASFFRVLAPLR